MSSTNWEQIAAIIGAAHEIPVGERDAFLIEACDGDEALLGEVRSLMAGAQEFPSVLNSPFGDSDSRSISEGSTITIDFDDPDKLVGQVLDGHYLVVKNLADDGADKGGIGLVYLAKDLKLMGKQVVVKILQEKALAHPDIVRKFEHEKEALIRLEHPNIVRILYSGKLQDGNPFMVMEYISGHSLRKLLTGDARLRFDLVAHIAESVCNALHAAHKEKVFHRDIKPENIMLTPRDEGLPLVRVIDFGIARVGDSQLAPGTEFPRFVGTVRYMAPEQLFNDPDLSSSADIYSFAIVVYEMLTGKLPFNPISIPDMHAQEKSGVKIPPHQLRPELPVVAERVLLSALRFEAVKRPQDAREWGQNLANSLTGSNADLNEPFDPAAAITVPYTQDGDNGNQSDSDPRDKPSSLLSPLKLAALIVLILGLLSIPIGYLLLKRSGSGQSDSSNRELPISETQANTNANAVGVEKNQGSTRPVPGVDANRTDPGSEPILAYFLTVQKMRNSKPFGDPFKSSGQDVYESGDKFRMNFTPDADGYMYVFNEGKDSNGNTGYYLLFPTLNVNNNSSKVLARQDIQTDPNTFGGAPGSEIIWMVWSKQKRDDLESVWRSVADKRNPVTRDQNIGMMRAIQNEYNANKPDSEKDSINQRTIVKAKGDTVIHRFELEHH